MKEDVHRQNRKGLVSGYGKRRSCMQSPSPFSGEKLPRSSAEMELERRLCYEPSWFLGKRKRGNIFFKGQESPRPSARPRRNGNFLRTPGTIHFPPHEHPRSIWMWAPGRKRIRQEGLHAEHGLSSLPGVSKKESPESGNPERGGTANAVDCPALMASPALLLLDEPSFGLSPLMVNVVFKSIKQINTEGVSNFPGRTERQERRWKTPPKVTLWIWANIIFQGDSRELLEDKRVRFSYLGIKEGMTHVASDCLL